MAFEYVATAGRGLVLPGEQILRDDVVGIGGGDEARNGNADALRENARGEIAEIAAGTATTSGTEATGSWR